MKCAAVFLLLAVAGTAHADPMRFGADFSPNPTITDPIDVKVQDGVYTSEMGYIKCGPGGENSSKTPAATFELTTELKGLRVRLEGPDRSNPHVGAILAFPDGTYACENENDEFVFKSWPKGKYTMYFYGPSSDLVASLRIEMPSRETDAVDVAKKNLPTIKLGSDGANGGANPAFIAIAPSASAEAGDLGIGCGTDARDRLYPIAQLEVAKESSYFLSVPRVRTFVITADGKCGQTDDALKLSPGTHTLWAILGHKMPASVTVEADDRGRALAFGDGERKTLGDLSQPLVLDGKVRAAEDWPSRDGSCGGTARAPDFYLTADSPLQKVEMSLLWSRKSETFHVYGPLSKVDANSRVQCDGGQGKHSFDLLEGTYAVWVGSGGQDATGEDFHILVRRTDVALDPLKTLTDIPTDLKLDERPYAHFYPFFDPRSEPDWKAIFTQAPDQLFVYTRAATDDGDTHLAAGEPLLLDWTSSDYVAARRWDGTNVRVRFELVTTDRPATISLPTKATVPTADDVSSAEDLKGPEDLPAISAYAKLDDKFQGCEYAYLKKHDPTWGTGDDVYRISSNGSVSNVSAEVGRAADRKCGSSKLDKAAAKLVKQLAKTRAARYQAHLAAVRKRFGL